MLIFLIFFSALQSCCFPLAAFPAKEGEIKSEVSASAQPGKLGAAAGSHYCPW